MDMIARYKGELYRYLHNPDEDIPYWFFVENKELPDLENCIEHRHPMSGRLMGYVCPIDITDERIEEVFYGWVEFKLDTAEESEKDLIGSKDYGAVIGNYVEFYSNFYTSGSVVLNKGEYMTKWPVAELKDIVAHTCFLKKDGIIYGLENRLEEQMSLDKSELKEFLEQYRWSQF